MAIRVYKTKSGERKYQARLSYKGRSFKNKTFGRRIDAQMWLQKEGQSLVDGEVGRMRTTELTLREFYEKQYVPNLTVGNNTREEYFSSYKCHILPKFGHRRLIDIQPREWVQLKQEMVDKGLSAARANRVHTAASAMYTFALKNGLVACNPLRVIGYLKEELRERDYWSFVEAREFLTWALETKNDLFELYLLAYETGLRISELIGLQWDCVNFDSGVITVRRRYCVANGKVDDITKSGKSRAVGLNSASKNALRELRLKNRSQYVFSDRKNKHFRYEYLRDRFKRDQLAAKARVITLHEIRHTFASHFMMNGGNVYELQKILGHAETGTTERYAHLAPEHLASKTRLVSFEPCPTAQVLAFQK